MTGQIAGATRAIRSNWPWYLLGLCLLWFFYQSGLLLLWTQSDEYGHGLMVAGSLAYVVHKRRHLLGPLQPAHWVLVAGVGILGVLALVSGQASGIKLVGYYGLLAFGVAVALAVGGQSLAKRLLVPFLILALLFPLPQPLGPMLTAELQLLSSRLGVWFIRAVGGTVYLEGNVLDMGSMKLLVAEACAGLRYLFPLMSLGAIVGYVLAAPIWLRISVFLLAAPITIVMNSFRIAVTGLLVENGGLAHTEGFLHFFEGWVVFVVATALLLGCAALMLRFAHGGQTLAGAFFGGLGGAMSSPGVGAVAAGREAGWGRTLKLATVIVATTAVLSVVLELRGEREVPRRALDEFPRELGSWSARREALPAITELVAGASDYVYADYVDGNGGVANVYIAYYATQKLGQVPHSPQVCIPSGGWEITGLDSVSVPDGRGGAFAVNRLTMTMGRQKMLAYYWLKQGNRIYRKELQGRIALAWFGLVENRTDGALVRLVTDVRGNEDAAAADRRLASVAAALNGVIGEFVPD